MRRFLLRLLRFGRPTTAERHRKALEGGVAAGLRYIQNQYGSVRPPGNPHWYDR